MSRDYLLTHGIRRTAQDEQARNDQIPNSAGGYVWQVDNWTLLRRFLILGSEGGSYYADERKLTGQAIACVRQCIVDDGPRTVAEIVAVSDGGNAPKNDPALFALASCISLGDPDTRRAAAEALPRVARIGTHLYHFVAYTETMRGWGRTMRWAIKNWYLSKGDRLAYDVVKYRQRDGWSHRDLLRLAHPKATPEQKALFAWITHPDSDDAVDSSIPALIPAFVDAQSSLSPAETAALTRAYRLPREALKTEHLTSPEVWDAMLSVGMPMTAMIRNLANMTRAGVLTTTSEGTKTVLATLADQDAIRKSRIHPLNVLFGMATYASGHGLRGGNTWDPVRSIVDALDGTFYLAFGNVVPTMKRILLALDVSGSMMGGQVAGVPLSPRTCAAAMALITAKVEPLFDCVGFYAEPGSHSYRSPYKSQFYGYENGLTPLPLSSRQRLDDVVKMVDNLPFGGTDCALPMLYATEKQREYDAFIIYTDAETWAGNIHPFQALKQYRERYVADAKLVTVGMVSNGFSIADPNDAGMLDVVGFDTSAPSVISEFVRGSV